MAQDLEFMASEVRLKNLRYHVFLQSEEKKAKQRHYLIFIITEIKAI